MKERLIGQNMNDLYQILREDTEKLMSAMILFLKEFRTSPQSKYVDLANDIDSKKNIFPYWYEEKILANLQVYLSKNRETSLINFILQKKKRRLL